MGSARIVLEKISAIPPRLIHRIRRGLLAVYVEVLLLTQNIDYGAATQKLKGLLKETQALPHIEMMSETEIAEEIAAYRSVQ